MKKTLFTSGFFGRFLLAVSAFLTGCQAYAAAAALPLALNSAVIMEYRYWDWGVTPRRDDYQVTLLNLALEKTRATYGPYKISRIKTQLSTRRVRRELSRGKMINVQVGPWREVAATGERGTDPAIRIDIPLYKGLLGYRQLIIRREDEAIYSAMVDESRLRARVAGQVSDWIDVSIYQANNYKVVSNANITNLLAMLKAKRYDYVPMSIVEAPLLLAAQGAAAEELMLAARPLVYFPLPFVFYISINEPELAARLELGLKIAIEDGSFDKLFALTFAAEVDLVRQQKDQYFILKNPLLPEHLQLQPGFVR